MASRRRQACPCRPRARWQPVICRRAELPAHDPQPKDLFCKPRKFSLFFSVRSWLIAKQKIKYINNIDPKSAEFRVRCFQPLSHLSGAVSPTPIPLKTQVIRADLVVPISSSKRFSPALRGIPPLESIREPALARLRLAVLPPCGHDLPCQQSCCMWLMSVLWRLGKVGASQCQPTYATA
jgi:hypothetical protein